MVKPTCALVLDIADLMVSGFQVDVIGPGATQRFSSKDRSGTVLDRSVQSSELGPPGLSRNEDQTSWTGPDFSDLQSK